MIARARSVADHRLAGCRIDLPEFVRSMEKALEENASRLLVLNCNRPVEECPESRYVTYFHIPFPFDYNWNEINNFTKDVGLAFDTRITAAIKNEIDKMDREQGALIDRQRPV